MKAVFIIFNQAHSERVEYILDQQGIGGYTWWPEVMGRGSKTGAPRLGTHTWPEMNSALITVIPDEKADPLLEKLNKLDKINEEIGVRAFLWSIDKML